MVTLQDGSVHHITDGRALQPSSAAVPIAERFLDAKADEEYGIEATIDADGHIVLTGK